MQSLVIKTSGYPVRSIWSNVFLSTNKKYKKKLCRQVLFFRFQHFSQSTSQKGIKVLFLFVMALHMAKHLGFIRLMSETESGLKERERENIGNIWKWIRHFWCMTDFENQCRVATKAPKPPKWPLNLFLLFTVILYQNTLKFSFIHLIRWLADWQLGRCHKYRFGDVILIIEENCILHFTYVVLFRSMALDGLKSKQHLWKSAKNIFSDCY